MNRRTHKERERSNSHGKMIYKWVLSQSPKRWLYSNRFLTAPVLLNRVYSCVNSGNSPGPLLFFFFFFFLLSYTSTGFLSHSVLLYSVLENRVLSPLYCSPPLFDSWKITLPLKCNEQYTNQTPHSLSSLLVPEREIKQYNNSDRKIDSRPTALGITISCELRSVYIRNFLYIYIPYRDVYYYYYYCCYYFGRL